MIYADLNRTNEAASIFTKDGSEIVEIYGGLNETDPIFYKTRTINGAPPLSFKALGQPLKDYVISGNTIVSGGKNLFNKDTCDPRTNVYLDSSGDIVTLTGENLWTISDYIVVETGDYTASGLMSGGQNPRCCIYDENKDFVRSISMSPNTDVNFSIQSGEAFVRLSVRLVNDEIDAAMFVKGTIVPSSYIPYGTPTPDSPVEVVSVGDRTENLFDSTGGIKNARLLGNGSVNYVTGWSITKYIEINPNASYIISKTDVGNNSYNAFYDKDRVFISSIRSKGQTYSITPPVEAKFIRISYNVDPGTIMMNEGAALLPYEPYGYKIPITCGGVTNNIYLQNAQTTRYIEKIILTGTETFYKNDASASDYLYYRNPPSDRLAESPYLCTHLQAKSQPPTGGTIGVNFGTAFNVLYLNFGADIMNARISGNTIECLKEYLTAQYDAGTPVTIYYVLLQATTGIINEPLHKIGYYVDTVSMTQASVSIQTVCGDNTLTVNTTVPPSDVSITSPLIQITE